MINFDNASTTYPKPDVLYQKTMHSFSEYGLNATRGSYTQADKMLETAISLRDNIKQILCGFEDSNVILQPSATQSLNVIIQGLDYSKIKNIYISPFEHNAVFRPLKAMQEVYDFSIEIIPFDGFNCELDKLEMFYKSKKPDLVILTHASNVFGNILPIDDIFNLSKRYSAITVLDASQTAGLLNIDNTNIDFVVFAGHKTLYGPTGIGGFMMNNNDIKIKPLIYGGTGILSDEETMPLSLPEKFEASSLNTLSIIGLKISTDWILSQSINQLYKKELEIYDYFIDNICCFPNMVTFKPNKHIGIISLKFDHYTNNEISDILSEHDILVRPGLHCSPLAHKHMGTYKNGTVRFSFSWFNKKEQIEILKNAIHLI